MTASMQPSSELARSGLGGGERSLEELIERVPGELLAAEGPQAGGFDDLEQDFRTDPCRFLRRACQAADYEGDERRG